MKIYGLSATIYKNALMNDSLDETLKRARELLERCGHKTTILITIHDVPSELYNDYPTWDGFVLNGDDNVNPGTD